MDQLRIGVVGCGTIAQIMYLPFLAELPQFRLTALCDASPTVVAAMGERFGVAARFTDHEELVDRPDVDAIAVTTPPVDHARIAIAAARAGKHVIVEKPMCASTAEADAMVDAARAAGTVLMVAYMKRYDPGYELGVEHLGAIRELHLIRLHDVIGSNQMVIDEVVDVVRGDDIPPDRLAADRARWREEVELHLGGATAAEHAIYDFLLGLASHDMTVLRGAFGDPQDVLSSTWWSDRRFLTAVLDYGDDVKATFQIGSTPGRKWFDEQLEGFGVDRTVSIRWPSPYVKHAPTEVAISEMDGTASSHRTLVAGFDEAFRRELVHFHECITRGATCRTPGEEGRADTAWLTRILLKGRTQRAEAEPAMLAAG